MLPKWIIRISKAIGYIVVYLSGCSFVVRIYYEPLDKVVTIGLSALGVIAALSALCFTVVPCIQNEAEKQDPLYAGEKFFHSSLLIVQIIFLKYGSDLILSYEWIKSKMWLSIPLSSAINILVSFIGLLAVIFVAWGFDSLNIYFWDRYEKRMESNRLLSSKQ